MLLKAPVITLSIAVTTLRISGDASIADISLYLVTIG